MEPQFKSFLVTRNTDRSLNRAYILVAVCILASVALGAAKLYQYSTAAFALSIVVIIIMLFTKKGNIQAYLISDLPLVMTPDSIIVGNKTFRLNEVTRLQLLIHSYKGMNNPRSSTYLSGINNKIEFTAHGVAEYHSFYLNSKEHATQLCAVLREYYRKKIPVTEKDMTGRRTWLMQPLATMEEVEAFKKRHKIP